MQKDDYIIEEFEKDIWLYLDNDLPTERMNYWREQINNNPEIRAKFQETKNIRRRRRRGCGLVVSRLAALHKSVRSA